MDKGQIVLLCPASVQHLHHQMVMDAHRLSRLLSMVLKAAAVCWRVGAGAGVFTMGNTDWSIKLR